MPDAGIDSAPDRQVALSGNGAQQWGFGGGSQAIAMKIAAQLGSRVVLSSPVRRIVRGSSGVTAYADKVTVKAKGESFIEVGTKDSAYYARRNGDAAVLKLDPAKTEELLKAFGEL